MTNLEELKAAAEKATPGPWSHESSAFNKMDRILYSNRSGNMHGLNLMMLADGDWNHVNNVEFIALANPSTVLSLISTIRSLERERAEARAVIEWADHHYANHDMSHHDFRVEVAQRCADFIEAHASVAADAGAEDQALEAAKAEAFKAGMLRAAEIAEAIMTTADGKFDLQVLRAKQGEDNLELAAACAAGMSHAAREIAAALRAEAKGSGT